MVIILIVCAVVLFLAVGFWGWRRLTNNPKWRAATGTPAPTDPAKPGPKIQ